MVQIAVVIAGIAAGLKSRTWKRAATITIAVFLGVLVVQMILVLSDESVGAVYWIVQAVSLAIGLGIARGLVARRGRRHAPHSAEDGHRRRTGSVVGFRCALVLGSAGLAACGQVEETEIRAAATPSPLAPGPHGIAYVANEATGAISVIDTNSDAIVATIGLGSDPGIPGTPQPNGPFNGEAQHHSPFYNGQADPHGLGLTSNGRVLLVAARLSSAVIAIDTTTNAVLGYQPVGREPHLATVRPGDEEAWVAVRGEGYLDVLKLDSDDLFDAGRRRTDRMESTATIDTMAGPSMVSFTSDGRFAFVVSGKEERVDKIDAHSRRVVASAPVPAKFSPFGMVTPDDGELYVVHKGLGVVSVLRTSDLASVASIAVGPRANHVAFVGRFAYVTVGGPPPNPADPDPLGKVVVIDRGTHQVIREFTGADWSGEPHGIWATPNGKLYIGHERGNRVTVLSLGNPGDASDDVVKGTVTGSATDLAFLKKPIDVVITP